MTASLIIDNLDTDILERLSYEALRRGIEVKALAREILRDKLDSLVTPHASDTYHDLDILAGTWSEEESAFFLEAVTQMRQNNEELWK